MTFDSRWIASEMNAIGLLSDCNYTDISNVKLLGDYDKANMILTSLENKVDINPKHLKTFVELLKKSPKVHSDAIEILQGKLDNVYPKCVEYIETQGTLDMRKQSCKPSETRALGHLTPCTGILKLAPTTSLHTCNH